MGLSHLISIVGAGPGDPDLLTVKALKRLQEADVILFDALIGDEILEISNPESVRIYVGKLNRDGQHPEKRQHEIHSLFLHWAQQNKKIVRLKTGDPMVFGRGAEEIRFCKENNLHFEVIPGITAGIAGSSLFNIPLTERNKNNLLLFYTCRKVNDTFPELNALVKILETGAPVVLYMGLIHLADLAKALLNQGIDQSLLVQILSKISQKSQNEYTTSLGDLENFLQHNNPETPSVIVIGKNARKI